MNRFFTPLNKEHLDEFVLCMNNRKNRIFSGFPLFLPFTYEDGKKEFNTSNEIRAWYLYKNEVAYVHIHHILKDKKSEVLILTSCSGTNDSYEQKEYSETIESIEESLKELNRNKISYTIPSFNTCLINALETQGYEKEVVVRKEYYYKNEYHDGFIYSKILKDNEV